MKQSIAWHEECSANRRRSYEVYKLRHEEEGRRLQRMFEEQSKYEHQIAEAKKRGKDGFDSHKFLKSRSE